MIFFHGFRKKMNRALDKIVGVRYNIANAIVV